MNLLPLLEIPCALYYMHTCGNLAKYVLRFDHADGSECPQGATPNHIAMCGEHREVAAFAASQSVEAVLNGNTPPPCVCDAICKVGAVYTMDGELDA